MSCFFFHHQHYKQSFISPTKNCAKVKMEKEDIPDTIVSMIEKTAVKKATKVVF
jgi:hypothetical protein